MLKMNLNGEWELKQEPFAQQEITYADVPQNGYMKATVPGDVHNDYLQNGLIEDPYYADNALKCGFITEQDSYYRKIFQIEKNQIHRHMKLNFYGIDTYGEIFFNGHYLGKTENMFLKYSFDITEFVKEGANELLVCIRSIKNMMKKFPCDRYFGCFNVQRIFMRKAQCHFSWDWAPDFPATGIWDSVEIVGYDLSYLSEISFRTYLNGDIAFFTLLDKDETEDVKREIHVTVSDGMKEYKKSIVLRGTKNNFTVSIENPILWWPQDLGEPFLYNYTLNYYENDVLVQQKSGKIGIREVKFIERPKHNEEGFTCGFDINGVPAFLKGANWVPLDIMTGRISLSKYQHSIELAKNADFNCLRVWGGSIYEKDCFYELCDEKGIMVWQDLAFACADIPDDYPGFNDRVIPEIEYQVKRLRNHPSIILWSGGNEKTGAVGKQKSRGDRLVNYTMRGITQHLDPTRPYFASSPWGYGDDSNMQDSGDCHCNSYQSAMTSKGVEEFRSVLANFTAPMASEIAVQGCSTIKVLKSFLPEDKLWPVNEMWDLHLTRNPYDGTGTTFAQQQVMAAEKLFGTPNGLYDFVKKSLAVHAEFVKSDIEFHRTRKGDCGGAMLWMYSDVWPCGTWAIVDYDMTPKAAYYSAKRANRPVLPVIAQKKNGIQAYVINDTRKNITCDIKMGQMDLSGKVLWKNAVCNVSVDKLKSTGIMGLDSLIQNQPNTFLFIEMTYEGKTVSNVFFHKLWKDIQWQNNNLTYQIVSDKMVGDQHELVVSFTTDKYARMVNVDFDKINQAVLSDNYFDMVPGKTYQITITSPEKINVASFKVYDWVHPQQ